METTTPTTQTTIGTDLKSSRPRGPMRSCEHCHVPYDWRRSPSSLKMTYCGSLCEIADLGFAIESLLRM